MEDATVRILLATYNGKAYIRQMVDSVLAQDHKNLQLVLSDDGSTDGTQQILEEYAAADRRVTHYRSGMRFGCAQKHFMHLLRTFHDAPYIMFCDQDDVWHRDKVSKTLALMEKTEKDPAVPVLVHTDLQVVDGDLQPISPSFCAHSGLDGNRLALNQLLVQNVVTGCTVMLNRTLAALACRETEEDAMRMHDWYLALLAAACGKTAFLPEATIDYRQHGNNSVGAKNVRSARYLLQRLRSGQTAKSLRDAARQAEAFAKTYSDLLTPGQKEMLADFAATQNAGLFVRGKIYIRHKLYKYGAPRILAQFFGL